jgi:hypothetical protein
VNDRRILFVQICQRTGYLSDAAEGCVWIEAPIPLDDGLQVGPLDEIHHQVLTLSRNGEMILNSRQVRVGELRQHNGFFFELPLGFRGGVQIFFYRTRALESLIGRAINRAEPTLTQDR